jgi:hypothetical protein
MLETILPPPEARAPSGVLDPSQITGDASVQPNRKERRRLAAATKRPVVEPCACCHADAPRAAAATAG